MPQCSETLIDALALTALIIDVLLLAMAIYDRQYLKALLKRTIKAIEHAKTTQRAAMAGVVWPGETSVTPKMPPDVAMTAALVGLVVNTLSAGHTLFC